MTPTIALIAAAVCVALAALTTRSARKYKARVDERAITRYLRSASYTGAALAFLIVWAVELMTP